MKLAEIYGITIADIVSPEKIASSAGEESDVAKDGSVFDGLYDLYIVEIDGELPNWCILPYTYKYKCRIGDAAARRNFNTTYTCNEVDYPCCAQ
jgi:hypothetical protein